MPVMGDGTAFSASPGSNTLPYQLRMPIHLSSPAVVVIGNYFHVTNQSPAASQILSDVYIQNAANNVVVFFPPTSFAGCVDASVGCTNSRTLASPVLPAGDYRVWSRVYCNGSASHSCDSGTLQPGEAFVQAQIFNQ